MLLILEITVHCSAAPETKERKQRREWYLVLEEPKIGNHRGLERKRVEEVYRSQSDRKYRPVFRKVTTIKTHKVHSAKEKEK